MYSLHLKILEKTKFLVSALTLTGVLFFSAETVVYGDTRCLSQSASLNPPEGCRSKIPMTNASCASPNKLYECTPEPTQSEPEIVTATGGARPNGPCLTAAEVGSTTPPTICDGGKLCLYKANASSLSSFSRARGGAACQIGEIPFACVASSRQCPAHSEVATPTSWRNLTDYTVGGDDDLVISVGGSNPHQKNGLQECSSLTVSGHKIWAVDCSRSSAFYACPDTAGNPTCSRVMAGTHNATRAELSSAADGSYRGRPITVSGDDSAWGRSGSSSTGSTETTAQAGETNTDSNNGANGNTDRGNTGNQDDTEQRPTAATPTVEGSRGTTPPAADSQTPAAPRFVAAPTAGANGTPQSSNPDARRPEGNYIREEFARANEDNPCARSEDILSQAGGSATCSTTKSLVSGARITEQAGQMVGSMSVGVAGSAAQSRAMSEQSQTAALEGAKKLASTTAGINAVMGATSLAMSAAQFARMSKHNKGANKLRNALGDGLTVQETQTTGGPTQISIGNDTNGNSNIKDYVRNNVINTNAVARDRNAGADHDAVQDRLNLEARRFLGSTAHEQSRAADEASVGAVMSMTSGVRSMMQMGQNIAQSKALQKQINALKNLPAGTVELPTLEGDADQMAASPTNGGGAITGDGASTSAAAEGQEEIIPDDDTSTDLGGPANMGDPNGNAPGAGPVAGGFTAGAPPGGGSGGSAGGGGANGTSDAKAATEGEAGPKMAQTGKLGAGYGDGASGGGPRMGGAGGGGGGNDAIAMPDLTSLLAQFQPKEGETGLGSKNGIMDYGGRTPSSEDTGSFLDRKANIFERIGSTYRDAEQRRRVVAQ